MKFTSTSDLRDKEVINVIDGSKLGCPEDFELDVVCGKLISMIVAGDAAFLGFGKRDEYLIPWDKIKCIGDDTVLVSLDPKELQLMTREKKPKKKKERS